jgi:hypothetical protein
VQQAQSSSDIRQIQLQLQEQRALAEAKMREAEEYETQIAELQSMMDRQLQEHQRTIRAKDRQLQEYQHTVACRDRTVERKERELHQMQEQLRASEQLSPEFQQSLQQTDETVTGHQQTTSAQEQPQPPVVTQQTTVEAARKDIGTMGWTEGKNAPEGVYRGAAVVHGNATYFRLYDSAKIFSYRNDRGEEQWSQLPDNPNRNCGLAVIDGLLTSVGGGKRCTDVLLSLTGEGEQKQWSERFPRMPTPRRSPACTTTEQNLVVAGGYADGGLDAVEVMNVGTKQWTRVSPLPQKCWSLSTAVCGDTLYLAGGNTGPSLSKSVFACSLPALVMESPDAWKEVKGLPVVRSTLTSCGGHLLAIGGKDDSENPVSDVYRYDPHTDSWNVVSHMKNRRYRCLACTLADSRIIVIGGLGSDKSVEILE